MKTLKFKNKISQRAISEAMHYDQFSDVEKGNYLLAYALRMELYDLLYQCTTEDTGIMEIKIDVILVNQGIITNRSLLMLKN